VWRWLSGSTWGRVQELAGWETMNVEVRHLQAGPWALLLPYNDQARKIQLTDMLTFDYRGVRSTGLVEHRGFSQAERGRIRMDLAGSDALALLSDADIRPDPTAPLGAQTKVYYDASGVPEDVLRTMISLEMDRLYLGEQYEVDVDPSLHRGKGTATEHARFVNLLSEVTARCQAAGLGIRVGLVSDPGASNRATLRCWFYEPQDKSARVRLSHKVGTLRSWSQSDDAPKATRGVALGPGSGTARKFREVIRDDVEAVWKRKRETAVDAADSTTDADMDTRVTDELNNSAEQSSFDLTAVDAVGMRYGEHYGVGDLVAIELLTGVAKVDTLTVVVVKSDGAATSVELKPGNPDAQSAMFSQRAIVQGLSAQLRQLSARD
jgi:hypothetical protein